MMFCEAGIFDDPKIKDNEVFWYGNPQSLSLLELMTLAGRSDRTKFKQQVLNPLLEDGLIEMTIPDKPNSRLQKYRLTEKGKKQIP